MKEAVDTMPEDSSDPTGPTGRLCTWLQDFRLEDVPPSVRDRAKAIILDGIACAIVGAQLPWSRLAVDLVRRFEGSGHCDLMGWGETTSAGGAALLNGTFIQGFELDDYHPQAPLHSASVVLPALWSAIQSQGKVNGARFLQAALAGFETGPRVGRALHGGQMLSRGWHSGSVFGPLASAAAVGNLLGLDAARLEDALGLAATQSCGLMAAQFEAMSKRMHHGLAARNGLFAALLAQGGYTGIKRVFERDYGGFLSVFGEGHSPDATQVFSGLGAHWETERIVIKAYAAMGGMHSPLDTLFDIGARRPLIESEIASMDVEVSHAVYHHGGWSAQRPLAPIGAQMNMGYALAVAVLDGAASLAQFTPSRIDSDDVWEFIPRIHVRHQPEFDAAGPLKRGRCRMTVRFKDGTHMVAERNASRAIESPQSNEEVAEKFRSLTTGLIEAERQAVIERMVWSIEELEDVRELTAWIAKPAKAAFQ